MSASLSPGKPISGSQQPYKEKTTLPRAPADVSEFVCVTALVAEATISVSRFGNINPIPFRVIGTDSYFYMYVYLRRSERISPIP